MEGFCCFNGVATVSIQSARRGDGASVSRTPHHILFSDQVVSYLVRLRIESYRGVVAASPSAVPRTRQSLPPPIFFLFTAHILYLYTCCVRFVLELLRRMCLVAFLDYLRISQESLTIIRSLDYCELRLLFPIFSL